MEKDTDYIEEKKTNSQKIKANLNEIKNILENIYSEIAYDNLAWVDDLNKIVTLFTKSDYLDDLKDLIEPILKHIKEDNKNEKVKKLNYLLNVIKEKEPDFLLENLLSASYYDSQKDGLKKSIQGQFYKLSQLTRLGKREEVIGLLLLSYSSNKKEFPKGLVKILKKEYDDDMFRSFIYAFLSNFIEIKNEENSND